MFKSVIVCAVVCVVFVVHFGVMSLCLSLCVCGWKLTDSCIQMQRGFHPQEKMIFSKAVGKLSWIVLGLK